MKPFAVLDNLYWVGALHPDLRVFDIIMTTKNGTTYNSYLVLDEKVAVIDTVKGKFSEGYLEHISGLVDPKRIDYVIVQHTEPDHGGSLEALLAAAPQAEVVCAKAAAKYVANTLNREVRMRTVGNRETLTLGKRTLTFLPAPFIHWPDTMMTVLADEGVLFSCDLFGAHFCDSRMFDDMIPRDVWPDFQYYFESIMRPFRKNVHSALEKVSEFSIKLIAPSHGPIIRRDVEKYFAAYRQWSAPLPPNPTPQALIFYASAHGNTERMAEAVAQGLRSEGVEVELYDALNLNLAQHIEKIERADALILGSPTINNDAVKPIWDVLNSLTTIDIKGKVAACFGSYAWSGEATELIQSRLAAMKFKLPLEPLRAMLVPSAEELEQCVRFGAELGRQLRVKE